MMGNVKFKIKTGDKVVVTAGNHKGKTGTVLKLLREKNRAIVEDVNIITKHVKPSAQKPEGGEERTEAAIHMSNLMILDPKSGDRTRIGKKLDEKSGKLKRYSKKTGEFID